MSERRRQIHYESAVQKGVCRAAKRCVAVPHELVCHDRGPEQNDKSHIFEKERGYRSAWPDSELVCESGLTANVELKRPGWTPPREGTAAWPHWRDQKMMLERLAALGRVTGVANSVLECVTIWHDGGIPLTCNWRTVAVHEDQIVAADIRKQIERRDNPKTTRRYTVRGGSTPPQWSPEDVFGEAGR